MAKRAFAVGDRVAVYADARYTGEVRRIRPDGPMTVDVGFGHLDTHPKACRRLVRRKRARRRSVWINPKGVLLTLKPDEDDPVVYGQGPWTLFVEARPGKERKK